MTAKKPKNNDRKEKAPSGFAAIYIRVSSQDQGDRFSLPSQLKRLKEMAERDGKRVREDWIFTDKHTGKLESRPEFDRLKALVRTGQPDKVYIYDVSRFARKTLDALWLLQEFKRYGVDLGFAEMPFEDTPTGRMTFTNLAAVAEFLGEKIIEDSKRGSREKLEQGKLTHGSACYAYRYIDKRQPNGSRLEIDPSDSSVPGLSKVQVVRDVYQMRLERKQTSVIVNYLNDHGILSAGYWGKGRIWVPPGPWTRQTVLQMLKNPTYKGEHLRSGIIVPCDPIIEPGDWNQVQRISEELRQQWTGRPSDQYLLRSYMFCGKCGFRCNVQTDRFRDGKPPGAWRCNNLDRERHRKCDASSIRADVIELFAWGKIWGVIKDPGLLLHLGAVYYAERGQPQAGAEKDLQKQLRRLEERIEDNQKMMRDRACSYASGLADIRQCQEQIKEIQQQLRFHGGVVGLPLLAAAEAGLREISQGPEPSTFTERRNILDGILELKLTYLEGKLDIEGWVPIPDPALSIGSSEKKCKGGFSRGYTSFAPIPFEIHTEVAA